MTTGWEEARKNVLGAMNSFKRIVYCRKGIGCVCVCGSHYQWYIAVFSEGGPIALG